MKRVCILGGGPAGVGAAWKLAREDRAQVTLVERKEHFGGNAGSFEHDGHRLDYGSHRLHPACAPEILSDIQALLGDELLDRPRHGRIDLLGNWVHFPLKPVDLALNLPKGFALGSLVDAVTKPLRSRSGADESFASVLRANLGGTICQHFYLPYAWKIWGRNPETLSPIQAKKRVSAGSFSKLLKKLAGQVPGLKPPGAGRFFYPRGGYGRISEAYAESAQEAGAELLTGWTVTGVEGLEGDYGVHCRRGTEERVVSADHVWSTLPIPLLARFFGEATPAAVREAAEKIEYRAMLLVYLELPVDRFTEFDAHYFPGRDVTITRLSEPKNYAVRTEPAGRTVLCGELPCDVGDGKWTLDNGSLGQVMARDLERARLPLPAPPVATFVRRLPQAYPIYTRGYERPLAVLDAWADSVPGLLTYGRQGLFAHDNTHHALAMAYAACACLSAKGFDRERWSVHRREFEKHVVED